MARAKRSAIGENLVKYRTQTGLSQEEVAQQIGIKRGSYAKYETNTIPPIPTLAKIGAFFGITTDELLATNNSDSILERIKNIRGVDVILSARKVQYLSNVDAALDSDVEGFSDDEIDKLLSILTLSREQRDSVFDFISSALEENNH